MIQIKSETIQALTNDFESFVRKTERGVEFWLARDLQKLLGYAKWDNFKNVIEKAKVSSKSSNQNVFDHFADVGKTIDMSKGAKKEIDDVRLTRYACYIIAQNGDSNKKEELKKEFYIVG